MFVLPGGGRQKEWCSRRSRAPPKFHTVIVHEYLGDLAVDVCGVLLFRNAANAPQLQRHARPLKARGTNKVALVDMFLQLQELSLKDPAVRS